MKVIELIRIEEHWRWGTFGVLRMDKRAFCVTLEPADLENKVSASSIPAQQYMCSRYHSPKYGFTFQVNHVPGRTYILFHSGNIIEHTEGCILLARKFGVLKTTVEKRAILNSGETFKEFLKKLENINEFHLTIKEVY